MNNNGFHPQEIILINKNAHREGFIVGVAATVTAIAVKKAFEKASDLGPVEKRLFNRFIRNNTKDKN